MLIIKVGRSKYSVKTTNLYLKSSLLVQVLMFQYKCDVFKSQTCFIYIHEYYMVGILTEH